MWIVNVLLSFLSRKNCHIKPAGKYVAGIVNKYGCLNASKGEILKPVFQENGLYGMALPTTHGSLVDRIGFGLGEWDWGQSKL